MFNFNNLFKKKKDDDEIKIRIKPARKPRLDTSKMSVAPLYKNGRQSSNSFFRASDQPRQQNRPQRQIQQNRQPNHSQNFVNRFSKFLNSGGKKDSEYNNYSTLRQFSDTNRRLIERAIPTPRMDSPEYNPKNPVHLVGSGARGFLRSNVNALPTLASDTLSGLHRLGKSAVAQKDLMDRGVFATDDLNKRDEIVRQYYANKPRYKYNPISGKTNTIQQENLFARKDQGQSRGYAGMHAALDTFLPFFDIADFGAPLHAVAPAMKFGIPAVGGFLRRAEKVTPEAVQTAKNSNLFHRLNLGKDINDGKMIRDNFVEFPTNSDVTTTNIQLKLNEIEPGQQGVYLLSDIMDNPNYFDTVDPKEIPQVVISKTNKPDMLTNAYYNRDFNTIFLEVPARYDTVRDGKVFTKGVSEREQARHVASILEHEMTHGATKADSLFPSGSSSDYFRQPVTVAAKQLDVPNNPKIPYEMYQGTYGELLAETDRVRYNMSPFERSQTPFQETFDLVVKQKKLDANKDILYPLVDPNAGKSYMTTGRQSPFGSQESALYNQSTDKPAIADNILNGWANTPNNSVNKYIPEGKFYDDYGREVDEFGNIITDGKYAGEGKEFADVPGYGENPFAIFDQKLKEITEGIYPKSQAKVAEEIKRYSPNSKMSDTEFGGGTIPNDLFDREAASPDFIGRVADIKGSLTDESLAAIRENTRKTAQEEVSSRKLTTKEAAEIEARTPQIDNSVKINGEVLQEAIKDAKFSPKDVEKLVSYLDGSATGKVPAKIKSAAKRFEEIIKARAKGKAKKFIIKVKEKQTVARANEMLGEITNAARAKDDNIKKLNPPKNNIKVKDENAIHLGPKTKSIKVIDENKVPLPTTPAVEQMGGGVRPLGPNSIDETMKRTPPTKWAKDNNVTIKKQDGKIKLVKNKPTDAEIVENLKDSGIRLGDAPETEAEKRYINILKKEQENMHYSKPTPKEAKKIKEKEIQEEKLAKMSMQSGDKTRMNKTLGTILDNLLGMIVPGGYNVQRQGRGGKALRKMSRAYTQTKLTLSGKYKAKIKDIRHKYNLSKSDQEKVVELVRGRDVEGATSSIKQAAKELKKTFEDIYNLANEGPLKSKHRKNYFPQYANKDAYRLEEGTRRYEKAIDDIMSHNENITREEAIKALKEFRDASHGKTSGHLRKKRKKTMPAWLTINNFDAALAYADEVADDIASLKNFGIEDAYANAAFRLIDETGFNVKKAKKYWEQVANRENPDWKKNTADVATGFTTATTLSTSVPKNLTQNVNTMIVAGILNTARGAGKTAKKFLKYNPEMTKANVWDDNIVFQEAGIKNAKDIAKYAMYMFSQAERFMRETAGEAAKLNADQLYKKAQSASKDSWKAKTVTRRLKKMGISESDFVNGSLKEDAKLRAMRNISDRTQFRMDADNVPLWSTTPAGRIVSQWQKFNYVQTMFMWDEVLTEAAHKNIAPLVTATIMTSVIGIPMMMAAKAIRGKDPTDFDDEDAWDAYEGLTGIPGSIYSSAKWQKEFNEDDRNSETAKKVKTAGAILGPTASMLGDAYLTGDAYKNVKAENEKKGLSKGDEGWEDPTLYGKREISEKVPYVGPFVKNTVFKYPGQNNLFNRDKKARGPAEFYAQEGNPVGIAVGATNGGFKSNRPISVSKVRDADTIVLKNGQAIRFAGINAPESDTAMGKEATNFIANQLDGKKVTLQYDADRRGVHGREVADILIDGKSLNEMLIREGLAKASSYGVNSSKAKKYAELQKQAEAQGKGFWGNPNLKIKLKTDGLGKDPNLFSRAIRLDRGKDVTDFNENNIKAYHDLDASSAKKKAKELGHDLTDEQLLQVRADADYFSDYFMGGKMNPTHDFAKENVNPLLDAYNKTSGTKMSTKLAHLYGATNYSEDEKQTLYEKMGVTQDDAERSMLGYIKGSKKTGISEDAKLIYDYMSRKKFNVENIDKLFEEKTLTSSNIKEMYRQGLLSKEEAILLANKQALISGKKFKLGDMTFNGSGKGSYKSGRSKKKGTIKITPYKIPEVKQAKNDYFSDLIGSVETSKSPTIKIKNTPKIESIDSSFKLRVPKEKKRAKIKVDFDTGLI